MDLNAEVFQKRMTDRRFRTLVFGLPPESAFGAFLRNKENRSETDIGLQGWID